MAVKILILIIMLQSVSCVNEAVVSDEKSNNNTHVFITSSTEEIAVVQTEASWVSDLRKQIALVDENMPGNLGVYIKNLSDNQELSYNAEEDLYFASTTKIPIAIALLQKVQAGELCLEDKLVLQESDYVDGAGDLLWHQPGASFTISSLLEHMLKDSDNSSTDMLIRLIGEDELNRMVKQTMIQDGINTITTILQVRHDAFSEIHENALNLTNMDILSVNRTRPWSARMSRLQELLAVNESELGAASIEEAFDRYYQRGLNSGRLESMGLLLERLYRGELLQDEHTAYLMEVLKGITTGERRIKAGLPAGTLYAQKTGTQVRTAVNAGIILPGENPDGQPIIIVVNARNFDQLSQAENAMKKIGDLLTRTFGLDQPAEVLPVIQSTDEIPSYDSKEDSPLVTG